MLNISRKIKKSDTVDKPSPTKPPVFINLASSRNRLSGFPTFPRWRDVRYYPYFQSPLSRNIWLFFADRLTNNSRWLVLISFLFFFYGSNSLEIQGYVPLVYLLNVWAVAVVSLLFYKPNVSMESLHSNCISAGETLPVDLTVRQLRKTNQSETTIIPLCLPPALELVAQDGVRIPALEFGETATFQFHIKCSRRGIYEWQGFRIESDLPFGVLRAYQNHWKPESILVYPQFARLHHFDIPAGRLYQPGGIMMATIHGDSFEYLGNREYREGDDIRNMDWRASARLGVPIVREYREEFFLRIGVVLDTHIPPKKPAKERELNYDNFERAISVCASVSEFMARSEFIVDLFAAGPKLFHLSVGRSMSYLDQILEILAGVEETPNEPFDLLTPELMENLAQMTSVVCILTDWNEVRQNFVEELRQLGAGLKVIVVRDTPCTISPSLNTVPGGVRVISKLEFETGIDEL